jgi:hypothetical protein
VGHRHGPEISQPHKPLFWGLGWPEKAPLAWASAFALAFIAAYELNRWIDPLVSVVDMRVSLVFLPAFVRVVAVLIAGLAGALGVLLGALVVGVGNGDAFGTAAMHAFISAASPCLAIYLLRFALRQQALRFDALTLLLLAAFTSLFGAALHGLFWAEFEPKNLALGIDTIVLMMLGDLVGVLLGFLALRVTLRGLRAIRPQNRV